MAGWRPVCEMQYDAFSYPCPRPADLPRRALPLADGRCDGLPDHDPHALRGRRASARAPRGLAGDVLRAHARDQGCDPVDARRRQGPPGGGDPLDPTRSSSSSPSSCTEPPADEVPEGEHVVPLGKARVAREGSDVTPDRLRRDGAGGAREPPTSSTRASRCSTSRPSARWTRRRSSRSVARPAGS